MSIRAPLAFLVAVGLAACGASPERREAPVKPGRLAEPTIADKNKGKEGAKGGFFGPAARLPELEVGLPDLPRDADLAEVRLRDFTSGKVRIDTRTLRVDEDLVVRYVVAVTTPGGVRNISHEAIRCDPNESKRIAIARTDGSWGRVSRSEWEPVSNVTYNAVQFSLAKDYFCGPMGAPRGKADIVNRLERGLRAPTAPNY
ncbi:MAG: CNP1-like family protein [Betaproteobacteria bacterium]